MPGILGGFLFAFKADTRGLNKGLDSSGKKVTGFRKNVSGLQSTLKGAGRSLATFAGAYAGFAGVRALQNVAEDAAALGAELAKMSRRVDVGVGAIQRLRRAFVGEGGTEEGADRALEELSKRISETARGTGEAKVIFDKLGISVMDSTGQLKNTETVLREVVAGMDRLPSAAERVEAAQRLMGESAKVFVNVARGGLETFDATLERMKELGELTEDQAVKLENLDQALADNEQRWRTLKAQIVAANTDDYQALIDTWESLKVAGIGLAAAVVKVANAPWDFAEDFDRQQGPKGAFFAAEGGNLSLWDLLFKDPRQVAQDLKNSTQTVEETADEISTAVKDSGENIVTVIDHSKSDVTMKWREYWASQIKEIESGRMELGEELNQAANELGDSLAGYIQLVPGSRQQILTDLINEGIRQRGMSQSGITSSPLLDLGAAPALPLADQIKAAETRAELKGISSDVRMMRSEFTGASVDLGFIGDAAADGLGVLNSQLEQIILHTDDWGESMRKLALTAGFRFLHNLIQGGLGQLGSRLFGGSGVTLGPVSQGPGRGGEALIPPIPTSITGSGGVQITQTFQSAAPAVLNAVNQSVPRLVRAGADVQQAIARQSLARARLQGEFS